MPSRPICCAEKSSTQRTQRGAEGAEKIRIADLICEISEVTADPSLRFGMTAFRLKAWRKGLPRQSGDWRSQGERQARLASFFQFGQDEFGDFAKRLEDALAANS